MPYFDDDFLWVAPQQGPPRDEDEFEDEDFWGPPVVATDHGVGGWEFGFLSTSAGYLVYGSGIVVDGGTQISNDTWFVGAGVSASMMGQDADLNGYPDGVTFAIWYGG